MYRAGRAVTKDVGSAVHGHPQFKRTRKLGKEIATYQAATFMHNDHALGPAVADVYLSGLQGVLVGTTTPEDAAQQTEDIALQEQGPVAQ